MPARKKLLTSSVSRKGISTEVVAIFLFLACCILAPGCHPCALVGWGCDLAANPLYYPQSRLNCSKSLSLSSVLAGQRYPQSNDQTGAHYPDCEIHVGDMVLDVCQNWFSHFECSLARVIFGMLAHFRKVNSFWIRILFGMLTYFWNANSKWMRTQNNEFAASRKWVRISKVS